MYHTKFVRAKTGITFLIAVFLLAEPASSQEIIIEEAIENSTATASEESIENTILPEPTPEMVAEFSQNQEILNEENTEALQETNIDNVTNEDLGFKEARILPDSPLYSFKRFGRAFRKAITFNPVKKMQLEVRDANQELMDAKRLIENKGNNINALSNAMDSINRFGMALEKIKEQSAGMKDENKSMVLQNVIDKQIKQQKIFENIEEKIFEHVPGSIAGQLVQKIQNAHDNALEDIGQTIVNIEDDPNKLAEHFDRALNNQRGSDFKDLRNIDALRRIQSYIPVEAREVIDGVEERALERFAGRMENIPAEARANRFEQYVKHIDGNEIEHLEFFDRMKQMQNLPPEIRQRIEGAKDSLAQNFENRMEDINNKFVDKGLQERMRNRMFENFEGKENVPDIGRLRAMEEIRQRIEFDDKDILIQFEQKHKEGLEKFKENFPDAKNDAEKFEKLSRQMAENPDPTTFRLLKELEDKVMADPQKREFIEKMKQSAQSEFVDRAQKEGEKFFQQITSNNPQDLEIFEQLKTNFEQNPQNFFMMPSEQGPEGFGPPPFGEAGFMPPGLENIFDKVINRQTDNMMGYIQNINDPKMFEEFQQKFSNMTPEMMEEIKVNQNDFGNLFEEKREFMKRNMDEGERNEFEARVPNLNDPNFTRPIFERPGFDQNMQFDPNFKPEFSPQNFPQDDKNMMPPNDQYFNFRDDITGASIGGITPPSGMLPPEGRMLPPPTEFKEPNVNFIPQQPMIQQPQIQQNYFIPPPSDINYQPAPNLPPQGDSYQFSPPPSPPPSM